MCIWTNGPSAPKGELDCSEDLGGDWQHIVLVNKNHCMLLIYKGIRKHNLRFSPLGAGGNN